MQCEERTLHLATLRRCCFSFTGKQPKPPKKNFKKVSYERKKYVPFGDYIYNRFPMKMRVVLILLLLIVFSVSAFAEADTTLIKPVINQTEIYYSFNEDSSILLLEVVIYQGCFYKENVLILCRRLEKKMNTFTGTHSEKKETSIFSFIGKTAVTLKKYELANHLGNVCVVISDRKVAVATTLNGNVFDHWKADVLSASDYYPFGMLMPGRNFSRNSYRFGFNGKEMTNEWNDVTGANYDYGFRIYSPGLGRFLSMDPLSREYPWYTPYQFAGNNPIWAIDRDGLEEQVKTGQSLEFKPELNSPSMKKIYALIEEKKSIAREWAKEVPTERQFASEKQIESTVYTTIYKNIQVFADFDESKDPESGEVIYTPKNILITPTGLSEKEAREAETGEAKKDILKTGKKIGPILFKILRGTKFTPIGRAIQTLTRTIAPYEAGRGSTIEEQVESEKENAKKDAVNFLNDVFNPPALKPTVMEKLEKNIQAKPDKTKTGG